MWVSNLKKYLKTDNSNAYKEFEVKEAKREVS